MERKPFRNLTVGQILDRSFQLYRALFAPLLLLTLIAIGPFFLLSNLLLVNVESMQLLPEFRYEDADQFWDSRFPDYLLEGGAAIWLKIVGALLLGLLFFFVVAPIYTGAGVLLANSALDGNQADLKVALRASLRSYGKVLGNSLLFWIATASAYFVMSIVSFVMVMLYSLLVAASGEAFDPNTFMTGAAGVAFAFIYIVVAYGSAIGQYFLFIRLGYFLPPVLLEQEKIGLARSWSITRKGFWRLLGMYTIYSTISYLLVLVMIGIVAGLGASIVGLLVFLFMLCAVLPATFTLYTISYRSQKTRNDGDDVAWLLEKARAANGVAGGTG